MLASSIDRRTPRTIMRVIVRTCGSRPHNPASIVEGGRPNTAQRIAEIERRQKVVREKLDRLDQAFLFEHLELPPQSRTYNLARRAGRPPSPI